MTRLSIDEIKHGRVWNGYDYSLQVWVVDGVIQDCGSEQPIIEISTSARGETHYSLPARAVAGGPAPVTAEDFCPNCRQASLITQRGCLRCAECGYKEC